jgi:acyl-coenzyme A synthetase/AMP-(fatty) acid ligase
VVTLQWLFEKFQDLGDTTAIVWKDRSVTYAELDAEVAKHLTRLEADGVPECSVVALEADFQPEAVAALLALIERGAVIVPLTSTVEASKPRFRTIAEVEWVVEVDDRGVRSRPTGTTAQHPLLLGLKEQAHPGLVLFSSGSTGEPKGALHDFVPLLEKFQTPRPARRTMAFLLFDHIGGINTLLHTLSNGGTLVVLHDRAPEVVCQAIETNRVELLPTSPTFINLLLVSGAHQRYDLSSLQLLTYGTEPMSEGTLRRIHEALPDVQLQQTYGLSELGILRSKSKSSDSLWVKIGGEGFETRVVDGLLEIKARSAMLGYLNAASPFTDDGWFKTGDRVEVDGDYYRILGRISEVINVGGNKVDPVEVEDALLQLDGVQDAVVFGEPHDLLGRIVVARVRLAEEEDAAAFRSRMRTGLAATLPRYKIPQKVLLTTEALHGERFKRMRR